MVSHPAFDGQVVFETTYITLEAHIVINRVYEHRPKKLAGELATLFDNFALFVACTTAIHFTLPADADADLVALQVFWNAVTTSDDYPALWDLFLKTISREVNQEWVDAYAKGQPRRLRVERALGNGTRLTDEEKKIPTSSSGAGNDASDSAPRPS